MQAARHISLWIGLVSQARRFFLLGGVVWPARLGLDIVGALKFKRDGMQEMSGPAWEGVWAHFPLGN